MNIMALSRSNTRVEELLRFSAFPGFKASGAVPADLHKTEILQPFCCKGDTCFCLWTFFTSRVLVENTLMYSE